MNRKSKPDGSRKGADDDEVDSLLRAAEDELLLNLTLNSHMSRGSQSSSSSYIDPDLDRRFKALKSTPNKPPPPPHPNPKPQPTNSATTIAALTENNEGDDDLLARFAALKATLPSSASSSSSSSYINSKSKIGDDDEGSNRRSDEGVDEDEVQKLIQWAIDAARLDPSPPTDDDDDDDDYSDDDNVVHRKKGQRKKGPKRN